MSVPLDLDAIRARVERDAARLTSAILYYPGDAREDVPALLAEVERLRAALERAHREVGNLVGTLHEIATLTPEQAPTPLIMATMARDLAHRALECE